MNLTAEQLSAIVQTRYGALFKALELPPEQLARLRSLLTERQQAAADAANAALINGLNPTRDLPTIHQVIEQAQATVDENIRNELGEPVYAACREVDRTLSERNSVGDFARVLAAAQDPLGPEQEMKILQILKMFPAATPPPDVERAIFDGIKTRANISDEAVTAAAKILSPHQLALLQELRNTAGTERPALTSRSGRQD